MPGGEEVTLKLAERGSQVGAGKKALWMREVRKLTESGHQTSLISTAYKLDHTKLAAGMFTRWCQENFFRYMMQHFAIDLLSEYGLQNLPMVTKFGWIPEITRLSGTIGKAYLGRRGRR